MIAAVIPTRYHPPELAVLLEVLDKDGVDVFLLESERFGHRVYTGWNRGVAAAERADVTHIAVLNDDIAIKPGALRFMADVLDDYPDIGVVYPDVSADWDFPIFRGIERTTGTWGAGGMTGFAFMFRSDLGIEFDEAYSWWYGDDAFEEDVRDSGLAVARVTGVPIRHVPGRSASKRDDLGPLIEADRARWEARKVAA
jgi:hypothetical protein